MVGQGKNSLKLPAGKSCLILGATGFIGGHIALTALEQGYRVRGLRRDPNSTGHIGHASIDWVDGDLQDYNSLARAMQGVEVVFHAAGFYPVHSKPDEVQAQVAFASDQIDRVIDAARQASVARLIYTSSLTTIGNPSPGTKRLADETDLYQPGSVGKSAYYEAKSAMESRVLAASQSGFPAVVLNPTAVFGPGDIHLTMGRLLLAARRGMFIAWVPATTNVIDVRDVAAGHLAAARRGMISERYILGAYNTSLRTLIDLITSQFRVHPPRFEVSLQTIDRLVRMADMFHISTGNHLRAISHWQSFNTEKAETQLGLTHRPFEQTIIDSFEWFRSHGMRV